MKVVLRKVLSRIKPAWKEIEESQSMFRKISGFIREEHGLEARLMGSVAKNTFLKGDKDLDIFIFFQPATKRDELEKKGLETGKSVFEKFRGNFEVSYAEHPYTRGNIKDFRVEIVPAYELKSTAQLKSAVDRTPFHTKYVLDNLKANDEVRLLKKFLKGIGCYGSDLKTEGFGGYLCELLIIKYGSFENVLKEAQYWRHQEIIDIENGYEKSAYSKLKKKFRGEPLIFIDPVDRNRNVAAVVSREKLARFIFSARHFLEEPLERYFFPRKKTVNKALLTGYIKKKANYVYAITFSRPEIIEDILYPQLRRLSDTVRTALKRNDFIVESSWVFADKECGVAFEVSNRSVPLYKKLYGPSIFNPKNHQEKFVEKHRKVWLEDDRFVAEVKSAYATIEGFFSSYFKGSVNKLREKGVPSFPAESIARGFKVLKNSELKNIKSGEFWLGLRKERVK